MRDKTLYNDANVFRFVEVSLLPGGKYEKQHFCKDPSKICGKSRKWIKWYKCC